MDLLLHKIGIHPQASILNALKQMDEIKRKLLIVINNQTYIGLLSIGDIQRAIIKGFDLNRPVEDIMRNDYVVAQIDDDIDEIKQVMLGIRAEFMPVLDRSFRIVKVIFWDDIFKNKKRIISEEISLPVVIMAGGVGSRLKPITNIIPKALLPIKNKTMIEEIVDRFSSVGCSRYFITINYKADLIKYYLNDFMQSFEVTYIQEDIPMGTAGSLSFLKGVINETFFLTNCDILIEQDYSEILQYHRDNQNVITIIASLKHLPIPYGTIETGENGSLTKLIEKPEVLFKINSGMYILEPSALEAVPSQTIFNMTDLISRLQSENKKIGVFPISQRSWIDVGNWTDYLGVIKSEL